MILKFLFGIMSIFYLVIFVWAWVVLYCKFPTAGLRFITTRALIWPKWVMN